MSSQKTYTGLNIQYPISELILSGKKTIETRMYPIPDNLKKKELLIIETPGKAGKFKARIVGKIVFDDCFPYKSASDFYKDSKKHCVTPESEWRWVQGKTKWGWKISKTVVFKTPIAAPKKKGIVYTNDIVLKN